MKEKKNELVIFTTQDGEVKLDVNLSEETVWLNRQQMAELFDRDVKTIAKHINNALSEELDESTIAKFATTSIHGAVPGKTQTHMLENMDISVYKDSMIGLIQKDVDELKALIRETNNG